MSKALLDQILFMLPLGLGLASLAYIVYQNFKRSRTEIKYELKPNCLMTKYPLLFITGKRSLFYFLKYWNQLPEYLASHGYEVYVLPLSWRKESQRTHQLHKFLAEKSVQNQKFHLFFDESSHAELSAILKENSFLSIASATLATDGKIIQADRQKGKNLELKGLKQAIEEFQVSESSTKDRFQLTWKLHQNLTFNSTPHELLGWKAELATYESYLNRAHFLAERDFSG